jgi:CoA-transferase family III
MKYGERELGTVALMRNPLAGTLVLSLDQAVAAPLTSRKLADAGARVIKLERPEGDFARHYDGLVRGQCTHFVWLNRGKESVVADLTKAEDRRLFAAILAQAVSTFELSGVDDDRAGVAEAGCVKRCVGHTRFVQNRLRQVDPTHRTGTDADDRGLRARGH